MSIIKPEALSGDELEKVTGGQGGSEEPKYYTCPFCGKGPNEIVKEETNLMGHVVWLHCASCGVNYEVKYPEGEITGRGVDEFGNWLFVT